LRNLKAIVFVLVLANVGYYLYVHGFAPPPPPPPPQPPAAQVTGGLKLAVAPPAPVAPASPLRCVSIGPFSELGDSTHAEATLRGGGYVPRQRTAVGEIQEGTFVYVPIPATPAAAAMLRKMLKGAGFADAPDVPGPNSATVISLGVFNDPKRAQARLALAQQAGLAAQGVERKHVATTYWLDVDLKPNDGQLNPADLHTEATHGAQLTVTECPATQTAAAQGASAAASAADAHSGASVAR
jgi:hypothetical protein